MQLIIIISVISIIVIQIMMGINAKKLKKIALDENLNKIAEKYPSNEEICKTILKEINNTEIKIEESKNSEATIYLALQNKIIIGDTHKSFTRIQTMAHECLHSIQNKRMLIFNFVFSNIYLLFYFVSIVFLVLKIVTDKMLLANIFLILSFIYYVVKIYLENDAMIKAEYLAKEYMEEQKISTQEEIEKMVIGFKNINRQCIKGTNANIFIKIMIKLIIFSVLALIF